jgi:hypothetical protein
VGREGDPSNGTLSALLGPSEGVLVYDLGSSTPVDAMLLQGDAASTFRIDGSLDGAVWGLVWQTPLDPGDEGLRTRTVTGLDVEVRYLRVSTGPGYDWYPLSELQAFCRAPDETDFRVQVSSALASVEPSQLLIVQATRKLAIGVLAVLAFAAVGWVRKRASLPAATVVLIVGGGAAVLAMGWTFGTLGACAVAVVTVLAAVLPRVPALERFAGTRSRTVIGLGLLAVAAACAYPLFGASHAYGAVHYHDAAHYFLGAKYAPELGYSGLYRCLAVVEHREGRWPLPQQGRPIRDLDTNELVAFTGAISEETVCTSAFTPERWEAFKRDAVFLQSQIAPDAWMDLLVDHGYNATPVWTWVWKTFLIRDAPADTALLESLARIDEVLYLILMGAVLWGFGIEAGTLALLVFAIGFPWVYTWTGGGLGRSMWLLCTVIGVSLLRKDRPLAAGAALGAAGALQVFPLVLLGGPALALVVKTVRSRELDSGAIKLLGAAAVAFAGLVALGLGVRGPNAYVEFIHNSAKHVSTPSANRLGLGKILYYVSEADPSRVTLPTGLAQMLFWAALIAFVVLFGVAALHAAKDEHRVILSVLLLLVVFQLSSYYWAILMCVAPLAMVRAGRSIVLLSLMLGTQMGALLLGELPRHGYYAAVSLALILFSIYLFIDVIRWRPVTT